MNQPPPSNNEPPPSFSYSYPGRGGNGRGRGRGGSHMQFSGYQQFHQSNWRPPHAHSSFPASAPSFQVPGIPPSYPYPATTSPFHNSALPTSPGGSILGPPPAVSPSPSSSRAAHAYSTTYPAPFRGPAPPSFTPSWLNATPVPPQDLSLPDSTWYMDAGLHHIWRRTQDLWTKAVTLQCNSAGDLYPFTIPTVSSPSTDAAHTLSLRSFLSYSSSMASTSRTRCFS